MSLTDEQRAEHQEITEKMDALWKRHWELDAMVRRDKAQAFIGKFFRFRNNFVPAESWWEYVAITGVEEDGILRGVRFARSTETPDPEVNFKMCAIQYDPSELEDLKRNEEIPREMFVGYVSHFLMDQQTVINGLLKEKTA